MTDWRTPHTALLEIADSPTFDDLVKRWEGFERAIKALKRYGWKHRGSPYGGRSWNGQRGLRPVARGEFGDALYELTRHMIDNPVFDDPRASEMRQAFFDETADFSFYVAKSP